MVQNLHKIFKYSGWTALVAVLVMAVCFDKAQATEGPLQLKLGTDTVEISTFYNGTTLEIHGLVPEDADVLLYVSGPRHEVHLKEKGKVAGFLWMNKTDVTLENTPAVYMLYVPIGWPVDSLKPEIGVGYKALLSDIVINPESEDKDFVFAEYVKLMEESGVYGIDDTTLAYGEPHNGVKSYSATLTIPSKMGAGQYTVNAVRVQNGVATGQISNDLEVVLTGFPAFISSLAFGSPLLFGLMAVAIAIAAGLLVGFVFRGGGGAH